jgi:hypothetical protein
MGDTLTAKISNFDTLEQAATAANKPIVLFLDGSALADVACEPDPVDPTLVRFHLQRTADPGNRAAWSRILGRPLARIPRLTVAVGLEDASTVASPALVGGRPLAVEFPMFWRSAKKSLLLVGLTIVLAAGLFAAGRGSAMLRDAAFPPPAGEPAPYSLGRTQMAWWFVNIAVAFLLIWAATGAVDTITPQLLALMGISAATGFSAAIVDSGKRTEADAEADKARLQGQEAKTRLAADPANPQLQEAATDADTKLAAATRRQVGPAASGSLLNDLLTDANGYSLHRLQILVWTIIVTIVFWATVWHDLEMPELSETLLGLMGISSLTYLGFKLPENQE